MPDLGQLAREAILQSSGIPVLRVGRYMKNYDTMYFVSKFSLLLQLLTRKQSPPTALALIRWEVRPNLLRNENLQNLEEDALKGVRSQNVMRSATMMSLCKGPKYSDLFAQPNKILH